MDTVLKFIRQGVGGTESVFPNNKEQLLVSEFRYDAKRMGGAPTITCTAMHSLCLDNLWGNDVFVWFRGEKYFLKTIPSSSFSNTDSRYKHEITLVSERFCLDNIYMYNVVSSDEFSPINEITEFSFYGDVYELAERFNRSLAFSGVSYRVVVDAGITSIEKQISFSNTIFSSALQEIFNQFEIPFYFVGKIIHIGFTENAIPTTFKYGINDSLLSISKSNANFKVVNKVTGVGSSENIPFYYPNIYESKKEAEDNGAIWIPPKKTLMPSVYRETNGNSIFYKAINNQYIDPQTNEYYVFDNQYSENNPREHIVEFEDIKPTIKEAEYQGYRIDKFVEFAYDNEDNDDVNNENEDEHPYFFAKLRPLGFNLFKSAAAEGEMTVIMTSGLCNACQWVICVNEEQKNTVQVDNNGNLKRDDKGNIVFGTPQDAQNDTTNNAVWIALRKDINTFGVILPNVDGNYYPNVDDTFVFVNIYLPQIYIDEAERKLDEQLIRYMYMNNSEKFNFSINFSRIFFAENKHILDQLNENARIQIEYNGQFHELYVSSYSYNMSKNTPLPEIKVELTDTLTVQQNALQTAISTVKNDIMSSISSIDFLKQGLRYFLRKDVPDQARQLIKFLQGIEIGKNKHGITVGSNGIVTAVLDEIKKVTHIETPNFVSGDLGDGFVLKYDKQNKNSYLEVDQLLVRKLAYFVTLAIKELKHIGGEIVLTPASIKCSSVEEFTSVYRCYFDTTDGNREVFNEFVTGDLARCQTFNVADKGNRYYWRYVSSVGKNYIDLSKTDCDNGSMIPKKGDEIVQLGNRTNPSRQNAIILSTVGIDAPSFKQYQNINDYNLPEEKAITIFSASINKIKGTFISSNTNTDIMETIESLQADVDVVKEQTDKEFTIWFFNYEPSLDNYPANTWVTPEMLEAHEQDIFYYKEEGLAYRFELNEDGVYRWNNITDSDTVRALEKASKAQDTADGKRRNFVSTPTPPYDKGDTWSNATYEDVYDNDQLVCIKSKSKDEPFDILDWTFTTSMNSGYKKIVDASIKNLGDSIELTVQQFHDIEKSFSQITIAVESLQLTVGKIEFDDDGKIKGESVSGILTTEEGTKIFASKDLEDGNTIISYINQEATNTTISAEKIDLIGKVTFNALATDLQETIDGKLDESTIIEGNYIKTGLINTDELVATNIEATTGSVGGFNIEDGTLTVGENINGLTLAPKYFHLLYANVQGGSATKKIEAEFGATSDYLTKAPFYFYKLNNASPNIPTLEVVADNGSNVEIALKASRGMVLSEGGFVSYSYDVENLTTDYTYLNFKHGNNYLLQNMATSSKTVYLPSYDALVELGFDRTTTATIRVDITAYYNNSSAIIIKMQSGNMYNHNGGTETQYTLEKGDSISFLMVYNSGTVYAQLMNHNN